MGSLKYSRYKNLLVNHIFRKYLSNSTKQKAQYLTQIPDWNDLSQKYYKKYQDFFGVTEVLEAQNKVSELNNKLQDVQIKRREVQKQVDFFHHKVISIHQDINKSEPYSEEHYSLFEKAREMSSKLKLAENEFAKKEEEERNLFSHLSSSIQLCHEKERMQANNNRYWSVILSVVSAVLAALATSINNWMRIKEIKQHSTDLHNNLSGLILQFTDKGNANILRNSEKGNTNILNNSESNVLENSLGKISDLEISEKLKSLPDFNKLDEIINSLDENCHKLEKLILGPIEASPRKEPSFSISPMPSQDIKVANFNPNTVSWTRIGIYIASGSIIGSAVTAFIFYMGV